MKTERLQQLFEFLKTSPNDSFLKFAIGKEYEGKNDDTAALKFFQDIAQSDPDYVGVYYHLGKLLERMEAPTEALKIYTDGVAIARKLGDRHALAELMEAKLNLDASDEDDF